MITEKVEFEYIYGNQPSEGLIATLSFEETVNFELDYTIGEKQYELSNHLGNVLAVISDWKVPVVSGASVVSYTSIVISSQDYSPFGVTLSGRSWSEGYRYGFQNQEIESEFTATGYSFKLRFYSASLGKFFAVDPLFMEYPYLSTYSFSANSVLCFIDIDGAEPGVIFPSITPFTQLAEANKVQTENWKAFRATNWADMQAELKQHKSIEVNSNLRYLAITMHGNRKGIVLGPRIDENGKSDPAGFDVTGDFGATVEAWDLNLYKEYLKRGDSKFRKWYKGTSFNYGENKRSYDSWADNEAKWIEAFLGVLSEMPNGATVILLGCDAGQSEELMKGIYELSGSRLNIMMNTTDTMVRGGLLDKPLNSCEEGTPGWKKIGPETNGQVQNLTGTSEEGYLQLNGKGDNIQINTQPCGN